MDKANSLKRYFYAFIKLWSKANRLFFYEILSDWVLKLFPLGQEGLWMI